MIHIGKLNVFLKSNARINDNLKTTKGDLSFLSGLSSLMGRGLRSWTKKVENLDPPTPPPPPPHQKKSRMGKWRVLPCARFHP